MNEKCQAMKIYKTRFANPHGMDMINNYSCCEDVLKITQESLKIDEFRRIVKTQTYKGVFKLFKDEKVVCRAINWTNTNRLLEKSNIVGVKTGVTTKAGGCLSTLYTNKNGEETVIIVLGCQSTDDRFRDTLKIMKLIDE